MTFWCEHQQHSQEDALPAPGEGNAIPAGLRAHGPGAVPSVPGAGRAGGGVGRTEAHLGQGAVRAEHQAADTGRCLCPPCCHPHQPWRCHWSTVLRSRGEPLLTVPGAVLRQVLGLSGCDCGAGLAGPKLLPGCAMTCIQARRLHGCRAQREIIEFMDIQQSLEEFTLKDVRDFSNGSF